MKKYKPNKMTEMKKQILREIGYFYFERDRYDCEKTYSAVSALKIHSIELKKKLFKKEYACTLTLERPGLLIGKQGKTYDDLVAYLNKGAEYIIKLFIREEKVLDHLYSFESALIDNDNWL